MKNFIEISDTEEEQVDRIKNGGIVTVSKLLVEQFLVLQEYLAGIHMVIIKIVRL